METNKLLSLLAVVAVAIALTNVAITMVRMSDLKEQITGFATDTGYVNISVETEVSINFTNSSLNWGSGVVAGGQTNATLTTTEDQPASVVRGNWSTANATALVLVNLGNINATLDLLASANGSDLFASKSGVGQQVQ